MSKSHQENMGPLDCQRLQEAIMVDEDIAEMLNDSSPSIFHTYGDFYAFAEPPGRYYPWLGQQQTEARKHDCLKGNMLSSPFDDLEGFILTPSSNPTSRESIHWRDYKGKAGASGLILKVRRQAARHQKRPHSDKQRGKIFSRGVIREWSNRLDFLDRGGGGGGRNYNWHC